MNWLTNMIKYINFSELQSDIVFTGIEYIAGYDNIVVLISEKKHEYIVKISIRDLERIKRVFNKQTKLECYENYIMTKENYTYPFDKGVKATDIKYYTTLYDGLFFVRIRYSHNSKQYEVLFGKNETFENSNSIDKLDELNFDIFKSEYSWNQLKNKCDMTGNNIDLLQNFINEKVAIAFNVHTDNVYVWKFI